MKNKFGIIGTVLLFSILITLSCSKSEKEEIDEVAMTPAMDPSSPEEILDFIRGLGFSDSDIVDAGSEFIVEGDIAFPKDMNVRGLNLAGKGNQVYALRLVNLARQTDMRVMIDPSVSSLTSEINNAISQLENVGSNINFRVVTSGVYDILIRDVNLLGCASARIPLNGLPGTNVNIDKAEISGDSYAQRSITIAHELAHTFGLLHTDVTNGTHEQDGIVTPITPVPNWGGPDQNSIMKWGDCGSGPTQLSSKDRGAIYELYPRQVPQNVQISISLSQFIISWSPQKPLLSEPGVTLVGYDLSYGGFSGINFGGTVQLPASATNFTVPGVTPYPTMNPSTGGIQATVTARWSNNTSHGAPTVSRNKVNGVWL